MTTPHSLRVSSLGWPLFVAIFVGHEIEDNKSEPRDDMRKACWMK